MTRQVLIALGVMSMELGYQGVGLALDCPKMPEQTSKDVEVDVNAAVAKIGPVSGGELKTKTKNATQDILGKLPNADKVYLEQMLFASYCSSLRDDKSLSESQKTQRLFEYIRTVRKTIEQQAPKTKQGTDASPLKQPGKDERSGTRSPVNPPVPPLTQAERERAAKIEKELLELQERTKPWRLTPTQRAKIADKLSRGQKGTLLVLHLAGNGESQDFATDIVEVLVATGWTVTRSGIVPIGIVPAGLSIDFHDDIQIPQVSSLQLALESALGFSVQARLRPRSPANTFVLKVGSKQYKNPFPQTSSEQKNTQDLMASQLVVEGVNDPLSLVSQKNQPLPPKVTKFAKIKVLNSGGTRITNVGLVVIKVNDQQDRRFRLAVSSFDTLFERPNAPAPQLSVDLNPGQDEYFDAVIECNGTTFLGTTCIKGTLAIPYIDNGSRLLVAPLKQGVERLEELTVRASGDMGSAVTRTFIVKSSTEGYLVLQAKEH